MKMETERFIELAKMFLVYSLAEIGFDYYFLTDKEKKLISEEEFELFVKEIQNEN